MNDTQPRAEISLAGHPRASALSRHILHAACMAFFERRGIPERNWRGEIAAEVKSQTAKRTAQINAASKRHRARKKSKGAK